MLNIDKLNFEKARYERKFIVSEIGEKEIENILKLHPAIFSEIFYPRRVNNIYFDSAGMQNYFEHFNGNSQRLKIRIRWYGGKFGVVKNPVLELKIKNNHLGRKIYFPLKDFILNRNFSSDYLHKEVFAKSDLPEDILEKLKLFFPTLLNSYSRKYFISADKKYRITLDKELDFFRIHKNGNLFCEKIRDKSTKILELKYSNVLDKVAHHVTQHLPFRMTQNSKYLEGIDLLALS